MKRAPIAFKAAITIDAQRRDLRNVLKDVKRWPDWTPTVRSVVALDAESLKRRVEGRRSK